MDVSRSQSNIEFGNSERSGWKRNCETLKSRKFRDFLENVYNNKKYPSKK